MKVAVVLYEAVEPIDLAVVGVLSMATRVTDQLEYFTVAEQGGALALQNGFTVQVDHDFASAPPVDVVIVTGGPGWQAQAQHPPMLDFVRGRYAAGEGVASVCTGAMILAAAGLLDGKRATTKFEVTPAERPPLTVLRERFGIASTEALVVDEGQIVTGGGVTLGIDTTLYLLQRFLGADVARDTARIMEYAASWEANRLRLPVIVGASGA
ncbi:AraC family transcriptional regulator [Pandoraea capi]|uniref:AraC family transcriptional regulator n=1 Tax=Pandoraea capi TaxID=2508286 RepID=A0ABY6WAC7_9BURK|nr:DJ-1/PfpI family protein [Pandoraea capi]VVE45763.1 AraC family transcriptional regulator [Pandoraea capi]